MFCPHCAKPLDGAVPPACVEHGTQWELARNATAACVAVIRDQHVLVTRRAKAPWRDHWELPGGFCDLGEHPADAALREVAEEVGMRATLTGLIGIYVHVASAIDVRHVVTWTASSDDEPIPDLAEVTEVAWARLDRLPEPMVPEERRALDDLVRRGSYPVPS